MVERITKEISQAPPRGEPQRKVSDPIYPATLCPPMLSNDGTEAKILTSGIWVAIAGVVPKSPGSKPWLGTGER